MQLPDKRRMSVAGGVCLIVNAGAMSCEGAGPVTEAQLRRSAVLRELCGSSVGTTTLALSLEGFKVWQAHADSATGSNLASATALDAVTIWHVRWLLGSSRPLPAEIMRYEAPDRSPTIL
jgi:hypothetical protein